MYERAADTLALNRCDGRSDNVPERSIRTLIAQSGPGRSKLFALARTRDDVAKHEAKVRRSAHVITDRGNLDLSVCAKLALERGPHRAHRSVLIDEAHNNPDPRSWPREPAFDVLTDNSALHPSLNQVEKGVVSLLDEALAIDDNEAVRHPLQKAHNNRTDRFRDPQFPEPRGSSVPVSGAI